MSTKKRNGKNTRKEKTITAIKLITYIVVGHGLLCITSSYIMAWCGVCDTLSSLSEVLAKEVVAPITIYGVTKTLENIFEKNISSFHKPLTEETTEESEEELG